jgi:2-octaprenyl-6-methoxyphenol hydroxylase
LQTDSFDLVIAGGGMTGAMLAYALLCQNPALRVAIVEQQAEQHAEPQAGQTAAQTDIAPKLSFDSRSIALAAGSIELLSAWGLWQELAEHACAIEHIQVSDKGHFGKVYLSASEFNRQSLGQVIEIEWIGAVLYKKLSQFVQKGNLTWFRPDQIKTLQPETEQYQLELQSGRRLSAKLLVLCEGGDSPTRQLAGISQQQHPYSQTAVIANIGIQTPHQQRAYERFTKDGPLALLPLTKQRYSLVWTMSPDQAATVQQLPDAEFLARLQQAFGYRAGVLHSVGSRVSYPLTLKFSEQASKHRLLLCGNSLHNLHPIAGQGFNLALRDIAAIRDLVANAEDPGGYAVTSAYQKLRSSDMQQVIRLTDGLVRLFSNSSRLLALGRSIGLTALMQIDGLKQQFANQTMGLTPLKHQQQQRVRMMAAHASISEHAPVTAQQHLSLSHPQPGPGGQSDANV